MQIMVDLINKTEYGIVGIPLNLVTLYHTKVYMSSYFNEDLA